MIELYVAKGMSQNDATEVISRLARYRPIFLEAMMKDELDLPMPDEADHANSVRSALTMFASFAVFGMVHRPQTPNPTQRTDDADTDRHRSPTPRNPHRNLHSHPNPAPEPEPEPHPQPHPEPDPHQVPVFGFALVPLVWRDSSDEELFMVACCITFVALATLGSIKARFTDHSYLRSGAETVLLGGLCAAVAFSVGGAVASYLE